MLNSTVLAVLQVSGIYNLAGPEVGVQHRHSHQKGQAEDLLPVPSQEIQPASGAADPVLHCNHRVGSLHIHHCLVWTGLSTGQEQTITVKSTKRLLLLSCPPFRTCKPPKLGNGQRKSYTLDITHTQTCTRAYTVHNHLACCIYIK